MTSTGTVFSKLRSSIVCGRERVLDTLTDRYIFIKIFVEAWIFVKKNPAIFDNREILVSWHCSFGHPILGIDWTARLYYPNRVSLIYVSHPRNNPYVPLCYQHTMDLFEFTGSITPFLGPRDEVRYRAVKAAVAMIVAFDGEGRHNILSMSQAHRTLGLSDGQLKMSSVTHGQLRPIPIRSILSMPVTS